MDKSKVKVIDEFEVSPPPGSLPSTISLPLTFFDILWLRITQTYVQKVFFYEYPDCSLDNFTQVIIPSLKSSLSLTLQYFYPFASKLMLPPPPQKPYILFTQGDSVSFTVARYSNNDFDFVISDQAKDVTILHPFAPRSLSTSVLSDGTRVKSSLAVQVTLFLNQGICIGIGYNHTVADGSTIHHFLKSWASICKSKGCIDNKNFLIPSFDRTLIEDPYKIESRFLQQWRNMSSNGEAPSNDIYKDKVRSTFVFKSNQIEKLKQNISKNNTDFSSFVVTCSFLWSCLIKSIENNDVSSGDKLCYFAFPANCRNRFGLSGVPNTYFGNCLTLISSKIMRGELIGPYGVLLGAKVINESINELKSNGALSQMDKLASGGQFSGSSIVTGVAGSPKLNVYKTDFGWGCPRKTEVVHIDLSSNAISLSECRDEEGGIEIELVLKKEEMDAFNRHFEQGLKLL